MFYLQRPQSLKKMGFLFLTVIVAVIERSILPIVFLPFLLKLERLNQANTQQIAQVESQYANVIAQQNKNNKGKANSSNKIIKKELSQIQDILVKQTQKLQNQTTQNRLMVGQFQKLQFQNQVFQKELVILNKKLNQLQTIEAVSQKKISLSETELSISSTVASQETMTRIYIDGNNLNFAAQKLGIELDFQSFYILLADLISNSRFTVKYYTGVHAPLTRRQEKEIEKIQQHGYEVVGLPLLQKNDGSWKTVGDDIQISVDIKNEVKSGDRLILVSGDGDFIPLVKDLQERGVFVIVLAQFNMLNSQLSQLANEVIILDKLKYKIAQHTKLIAA